MASVEQALILQWYEILGGAVVKRLGILKLAAGEEWKEEQREYCLSSV